jgi:uncharacterized integral membrane protein
MIRKLVSALVLLPLSIVIIAVAVANRQPVAVSFDPFDRGNAALTATMPLFVLIFALVIAGVVLGGVAAWLRQGKWRGRARQSELQARRLRTEVELLQRRYAGAAPGGSPPLPDRATRLTIPPPAA